MDLQLQNKQALVCAASKGLGLAIAKSLASEGVNIHLLARNESELAAAAKSIDDDYAVKSSFTAIDLSKAEDVKTFLATLSSRCAPIDILVNNVGGPKPSAAADTDLSAWRQGFEQVFLSAVLVSQGILPSMRSRGFGRILTVTSTSVLEPIDHLAVSTTMRVAVTTFSKTLSREVAAEGVTVNTIMPGIIHTARIDDLRRQAAARNGTSFDEEMEKTRRSIPMQRLGKPEEFADLVTFLASPRAAYITGMNFSVDGGARKGW